MKGSFNLMTCASEVLNYPCMKYVLYYVFVYSSEVTTS